MHNSMILCGCNKCMYYAYNKHNTDKLEKRRIYNATYICYYCCTHYYIITNLFIQLRREEKIFGFILFPSTFFLQTVHEIFMLF